MRRVLEITIPKSQAAQARRIPIGGTQSRLEGVRDAEPSRGGEVALEPLPLAVALSALRLDPAYGDFLFAIARSLRAEKVGFTTAPPPASRSA